MIDRRGHSVRSLSEVADIPERTIWRLLREGTGTTDDTVIALATALEVTTDYLLGLSDQPYPVPRLDNLTEEESRVLLALRKGEPMEAIRIIAAEH